MSEDETPGPNPFNGFLRKLLEDKVTREASHAIRVQGFDLLQLPEGFSNPATMKAAANQLQFLVGSTTGLVNWRLITDSVHQQIHTKGDPVLSAA